MKKRLHNAAIFYDRRSFRRQKNMQTVLICSLHHFAFEVFRLFSAILLMRPSSTFRCHFSFVTNLTSLPLWSRTHQFPVDTFAIPFRFVLTLRKQRKQIDFYHRYHCIKRDDKTIITILFWSGSQPWMGHWFVINWNWKLENWIWLE